MRRYPYPTTGGTEAIADEEAGAKLNDTNDGEIEDDADSPEAMVRRENRAVFWLRFLVVFVLLTAASLTGSIVYLITSQAEQDAFETDFDGIASKVSVCFYE